MLRNANTKARLLRSVNPGWADGTRFLTSLYFRRGGNAPYLLEMLEELNEFKCMKCVNYKGLALYVYYKCDVLSW